MMQVLPSFLAQDIVVGSDYDVITMRQEVRQKARQVGLSLVQQAKIATAISAVARGLIDLKHRTIFTVRMAEHNARPALEIICMSPVSDLSGGGASLEQVLHFEEACLLVDHADLTVRTDGAQLTLRMWLAS